MSASWTTYLSLSINLNIGDWIHTNQCFKILHQCYTFEVLTDKNKSHQLLFLFKEYFSWTKLMTDNKYILSCGCEELICRYITKSHKCCCFMIKMKINFWLLLLIDEKILLVRYCVICLLPDTRICTERPRKVASLLTGTKLTIMPW